MAETDELPCWLALRRAGLGSTNFALLLKHFASIANAWHAPADELARAGIEPQFIRSMAKARAGFDPEGELARLVEHGIRPLTWLDEDFPESLRDIPQSPPVLFVRGSAGPQFPLALAVVGTRHVTPYGRQVTEQFCEAVAAAGVAIISGLARGVDSIAHRVALEQGVPTVGVLAGGVDKVYPRENEGLSRRILEQGCLVSEYPPGIPARPDYFPRRNRILSGLARATLVVEAGAGSGALHTANWAFGQGRDVFAVPGPVFSRQSAGTNQLIRESTAKLVATPEQLCEELDVLAVSSQRRLLEPAGASLTGAVPAPLRPSPALAAGAPDEAAVLTAIAGPSHVDEIARSAGLPVARVSGTLQILELLGRVRQTAPMTYEKA